MDNPLKRPLDVYEVLGSLTGVKSYGDYWGADCPVPGHKTPKGHLTVRDALDKALVTCHGRGHGYEEICRVLGFDSLAYGKNGSKPMDESKIVAMYNYTDAAWKLLYQVVRYEPKDFRQRRPNGNGGWHWDLKGVNPVLYRLPEVLRATNDGQTVYVVEGERDADNLGKQGLAATCNPMGAGKWRDRYSEALEGANVVIVVDKDAPGRSHARNVASSLVGKAASIKVIELPGENVKDASDWLAAGGTKEALERLANEAPEWTRPGLATQSRFQLTPLSELLREPDEEIPFLWEKTLIRGGLSICAAKPKVGKSTLARNLALALARGGAPFLGRDLAGPCPVVYLALEEKRSQVKKHFERMGATGDLPIFIHTGSAPEEAIVSIISITILLYPLLAKGCGASICCTGCARYSQ